MRFKGKTMFLIACMAWTLTAATPLAHAQDTQITPTSLIVDGTPITTPATLVQDRMMVPATLFNQLGAQVSWDEQYRSAVIRHSSVILAFPVNRSYASLLWNGQTQWQSEELSPSAFLQNNRSYVPLAYTANKLGMRAEYDAATHSVSLYTNQPMKLKQLTSSRTRVADASAEDMKWLYRITEAEAGGESYQGKVAVAASILNRVEDPAWPDTIKETIFQVTHYNGKSYYQYSPVLDKRIYDAEPSAETIRAVDEAMTGSDPSGGAILFYNPAKTDNQWVRSRPTTVTIGNHVFAK